MESGDAACRATEDRGVYGAIVRGDDRDVGMRTMEVRDSFRRRVGDVGLEVGIGANGRALR